VRRANDQIFQLSLTEIAFTLAFILLLLLGYMLVQADEHAKQLEALALESDTLATNRETFEKARADLSKALAQAGAKPDDVISSLVSQLIKERDVLKKRVDDLDKELSALTEVKNALDAAQGGAGASDVVQQEVTVALALKAKLEKQLAAQDDTVNPAPPKQPPASSPGGASYPAAPGAGKPKKDGTEASEASHRDVTAEALSGLALKGQVQKQLHEQLDESYVPGQEPTLAHDLVAAKKQLQALSGTSSNVASVTKENADLRGQLAFLKARLDARGGRDYPPCWADEQTGKVEFLFTIKIGPEGLRITPAWPKKRQADAAALPDVERLTTPKSLNLSEFTAAMQGIGRLSKAKSCRHYVYVKNGVSDLDSFNRSRYAIENFFYKLELRS
jgi:hypothetical protein